MQMLLEIGLLNAVLATVLAVLVAVGVRLVRRPALTHALWLLVLLKLLTPPLVAVVLPVEPSSEPAAEVVETAAAERVEPMTPPRNRRMTAAVLGALLPQRPSSISATTEAESASSWVESPSRGRTVTWRQLLAGVWLAGSFAWFVRLSWHVGRFQRLLRHACRAPSDLQDRARTLAARLGLRHCPPLWLVPGVVSPMIWPVGRSPRLLFPVLLLDRLDADQRDALLLHELAHVRRRDRCVRLVELLATGLFWWHPVVWWARREIHEAEEQCCEAWVVWGSAGASRAYALALLETVAFFSRTCAPLPATASGIGHVPHLRRRLTMIVQAKTPRSLSWPGCLVVLGLGLALLPLVPVQAEPPPQRQPPANDPPRSVPLKINVNHLSSTSLTKLSLAGFSSADIQALQVWLGNEQKPLRRTFLDLDPLANVKRADNFHSARPGNNLVALPRGVHTLGGMKFKVGDGVLQLSSTVLPDKPAKIAGIAVNQQVTKLHILHATGYGGGLNKAGEDLFVPDNTVVGRYRIHYEDTSVEVIPIIYGKDVRDWWYVDSDEEVNPSNVAWKGDNELANSMGARIRLYTTTWLNPKPDKKVVSIEFVSTNESPAGPFCVAITAEGR